MAHRSKKKPGYYNALLHRETEDLRVRREKIVRDEPEVQLTY